MTDLAPFSPACHTARADARQHRDEVHQRLGVLTPDPLWWIESQPQSKPASYVSGVLPDPLLGVDGRPTFGQRIGDRRRARAEERRALSAG